MADLTDEELDDLHDNADWHDRRGLMHEVYPVCIRSMVAELRRYRAARLTEEERKVLEFLANEATRELLNGNRYDKSEQERRIRVTRGINVLDRLCKEQGE